MSEDLNKLQEKLDNDFKNLTVVVPDGKTEWKEGEVEKVIEEKVMPERPVVHLSCDDAFYHMDRVLRCDDRTYGLLRLAFKGLPEEPELESVAESIRQYGKGVRHIAGLIELSLKLPLQYPGIAINWQYPESFLHPAQQTGLADILIKLGKITNGKGED